MRVRLFALAVAACAVCFFAVPQPPAPAEPQRAEAIDFDTLRAQATGALTALQQSREARVASAADDEFLNSSLH
jgi:hypothetical protein